MATAYAPTGAQPPSVNLVMRQGPQPGQNFSLTGPTITIGREAGNDLVVNDAQVSRRHATLNWDGSHFVIQDLGSANGTFVNGVRLTAPRVLQNGDVIGLGTSVIFDFQAAPALTGAADTLKSAKPPPAPAPVPPAAPPVYPPQPPVKRRGKVLLPAAILLALACLLAVAAAAAYFLLWPRPAAARPVVTFTSPRHGEQVEVGQMVIIHAVASDETRIRRVELWIDGQLHQAQDSALAGGSSPFPLVVYWQPASAGMHTLTARAFNTQNGRAHASLNVEAIARTDRDGDGVNDDVDDCPDEAGSPLAHGCVDRDGDGIPDSEDACPDEAGMPEGDGCPVASEADRDGDGLLDETDACPDEAGPPRAEGCPDADGDGVGDGEDACPEEPGWPEHDGCPATEEGGGEDIESDRDGDGLRDLDDACPDEAGLPVHAGCPDTDGDGVPNRWDLCPDEPGPPENAGCPATGAGDRDGDGLADDVDLCPEEPGSAEHGGCPPPGSGADDDGDGIPDDEEPGDTEGGIDLEDIPPFGVEDHNIVEFQALVFEVSHEYDGVYCYPSLAGGEVERYTFEPLSERQWDIAADLGSRALMVPADEPVEVRVACGADVVFLGPEGGWGTYYELGASVMSHPSSDWDGHVITVRSEGGDDGRWFEAQYRLCAGSCEAATFSPPALLLHHVASDVQLIWFWEGDQASIDGFRVYVDGSRAFSAPADAHAESVLGFEPLCGSEREFYVTAYQGDRESPPSNTVAWRSDPCPRVVRVTFDALTTFDLGDDEWWAEGTVGPIYGYFWASGSGEEQQLSFNAVSYGSWWGERDRGYRLYHTRYYPIQDIFDWIQLEMASCLGGGCPIYSGPEDNYVMVELGPDDDLTFGGQVMDVDSGNPDDILFEGRHSPLRASEITPGRRYFIEDRNMELAVVVDMLVGPEVGPHPDLTITDVTAHEPSGQLRIHVFNNAADLIDEDITVNLVRISTNERIDLRTWENVSIPAGGWRILQSSTLTLEPRDLRVIIDPDNAIEEMDDGNNIYETP